MFTSLLHFYRRVTDHALFFWQAPLLVLIAVTHGLALMYGWYWEFWWLDVVMHFAGGFWIGLVTMLFLLHEVPSLWRDTLLSVLISVLIIGIGWEVFEAGMSAWFSIPFAHNYWSDTLLDLIMDVLGAYGAWLLVESLYNT